MRRQTLSRTSRSAIQGRKKLGLAEPKQPQVQSSRLRLAFLTSWRKSPLSRSQRRTEGEQQYGNEGQTRAEETPRKTDIAEHGVPWACRHRSFRGDVRCCRLTSGKRRYHCRRSAGFRQSSQPKPAGPSELISRQKPRALCYTACSGLTSSALVTR